jgi:adenine deaminase
VQEYGTGRIAFCTDDREPEHIADDGHVNAMVRDAVALGLPVEDALVLATNGARWHDLPRVGAIAPGYEANVLLLPDLERFVPTTVLRAGRPVRDFPRPDVPGWARETIRVAELAPDALRISWPGDGTLARVIGIVPGEIVTDALTALPAVEAGSVVADTARDLAKVAVVERHRATGRVGRGLVQGFGLRHGALASTVAHDAHNLVVVGMSDADMLAAIDRLVELGGGMVVTDGGQVKAELPLPIAGLIADTPLAETVARARAVVEAARELGCRLESPFQTLAFLALSVVPTLKLTDRGLVDVERFELVPLAV